MPFQRKRSKLTLKDEERQDLERIAASRTEPHGRVRRATILLGYAQGKAIHAMASELKVSRPTVERCVDKALAAGVNTALRDLSRKGRPPLITEEDKAWVANLACQKPKELGYAAETWTIALLVSHIRKHCQENGHPTLQRTGKSMIHGLLKNAEVKPHKITYYLERRDPDFDEKMAQLLLVYKEIQIARATGETKDWSVLSYDEKPGIQAIKAIAEELPPVPGKHSSLGRDYEYKRLGTVSLLAGIDLCDGRVFGLVRDRHRSKEFVEFLEMVEAHYPEDLRIRLVLDNHSAHVSKETMGWLKSRPNRFDFIYTPKHGSWLNLVEMFFSKMTRSFLRHIRVESKEELVKRIYKYLSEVNETPVVFKWTYKLDEVKV